MAKVELDVITRGGIPLIAKREIAGVLRDCYRRFGRRVPYKVEVQIVDREMTMRDLLKEERFRLGITSEGGEEFICAHDAWHGYPRIIFCFDRLAGLNKLARVGAVRHEAAHSVLHGSAEYYVFRIPEDCTHTAMIKGIESTVLEQVLHHVSVAVKDFEATRFLVQHDYISCQFAFALARLQSAEGDKSTWKAIRENRQAKFIHEAALLKPTLFAHPLLSLPRSKKVSLEQQVQLGGRVEDMVEYLGDAERNKLLQMINVMVGSLTEDTHKNVDTALLQAMSLA